MKSGANLPFQPELRQRNGLTQGEWTGIEGKGNEKSTEYIDLSYVLFCLMPSQMSIQVDCLPYFLLEKRPSVPATTTVTSTAATYEATLLMVGSLTANVLSPN